MSHPPEGVTGTAGGSVDRRTFIRRGATAAAGLTVMSVPLLGCGSDSKKATGARARTIAFAAPQDPSMDPIKDELLGRFTKETGIKIQYLEMDYGTMLQKITRDAQNNTGVYDIEIINDTWIAPLAGPGLLHDLTELGLRVDDDIFEPIRTELTFPRVGEPVPPIAKGAKEKVYSGCIIGDASGFVYRTDVFDSAPRSWDEVLATVSEAADPGKQRYGYVFPGSRANGDPGWWIPFLYTYGGRFFDDDWEPIFNGAEGVESLEMLFSLQRTAPSGVAQFGFDQISQTVNGGQVLSAILYAGWVKDVFDPKKSRVADRVACMAPPPGVRSASAIGPFMAVVPRSAPNAEGAVKLLNWLQSPQVQRQYADEFGGVSIRSSVLTDPNLQDKHPYFKGMHDTLQVAQHFPPTEQFAGINDALGITLNQAYSEKGSAGAQTYLDKAADDVRTVLDRAGYYS